MALHSPRATAWSRSTSYDGGASPSDPCPPRQPNRDAANDLAAAQEMIAYHRNLHACSTRCCVSRGSDLARALANRRTKILASSDHLPPTSRAKTTRRAREPGPTSSGYVLSFVRRASARATPSQSAAPRLGTPSPLSADTKVVSTASCTPPKRGKPSTTTSNRHVCERGG